MPLRLIQIGSFRLLQIICQLVANINSLYLVIELLNTPSTGYLRQFIACSCQTDSISIRLHRTIQPSTAINSATSTISSNATCCIQIRQSFAILVSCDSDSLICIVPYKVSATDFKISFCSERIYSDQGTKVFLRNEILHIVN